MKKNYLYLVAMAFISLVYIACNKNELALQPLSETEQEYFKEERHFEKGIIGVYAKLTDLYWFRNNNPMHGVWLLPGDDLTTTRSNEAQEIFSGLNSSDGFTADFYETLYQLNNRANTMLQKIDKESGVYVTPGLKSFHKGEALFLRGYANFLLWNFFATSPLINKRIESTTDINPPNSKNNELLDLAISSFQEAAGLLPPSWSANNRGRVTNSSANGFLGKALVFRGTVTKSQSDHQAAIEAFKKITDKSLSSNFKENFNALNENNIESLFEYQANNATQLDNVWLENDTDVGNGSISAYWGFFDSHWSMFGKKPFIATAKLYSAFDITDPRRDLTVNGNLGDGDDNNDYQIQKYVSQNVYTNSSVGSLNNARILRYADVLLLHAEALIQSGGDKAVAIGLINQVRARARASATVPSAAPANRSASESNSATIMDWIRTERFLELAAEEGHRWMDLRRWHLGEQINLSGWNFSSAQPVGQLVFVLPKNLNLPIPNEELDRNPNVKQNTGY